MTPGATNVLNTNRDMIEPNAMPRHPIRRHELIDRSVSIHQKMRRDVNPAGLCDFLATNLDFSSVEIGPSHSQGGDGSVMNDHNLRRDLDIGGV